MEIIRPLPPDSLRDPNPFVGEFIPAPEVVQWIEQSFLHDESPLYNEEHSHLASANLGALWTNAANTTKQVEVIGQAEVPRAPGTMGKWGRARWKFQMYQWFGPDYDKLDFLVTLSAPYCFECSDLEWCALIEHELYHCAQAVDEFEQPKFRKDGSPVFAIRGHDVEEFVGVVKRYGAVGRNVQAIADAAMKPPLIGMSAIGQACGTCLRAVA